MDVHDDVRLPHREAARAELRRLLAAGAGPGPLEVAAFGPWGPAIALLRRLSLRQDLAACREKAFWLGRSCPALAELLPAEAAPRRRMWTHAELAAADFGDWVEWTVPGLLPKGLSVLTGASAVDRSWLALRLACAVGAGRVMDWVAVQGPVLHVMPLGRGRHPEAGPWRLGPAETDIYFASSWPPLDRGGLDLLRDEIGLEGRQLAVIDPLAAALPDPRPAEAVAGVLARLRDVAYETWSSILAVDDAGGSLGRLLAPGLPPAVRVDAVLRLDHRPGAPGATVRATAPPEEELALAVPWRTAGRDGDQAGRHEE